MNEWLTITALCLCIIAAGVIWAYLYMASLYRRATVMILQTSDPDAGADLVKRADKWFKYLAGGKRHA
jgi:hypothetical protein